MNIAKENADEDFDINDIARWAGVSPDDLGLLSDIARATDFRQRLEQQHAETLRMVQSWAEQHFKSSERAS